MKKFDFDKKYVQIALLAIIVIIFGSLFDKVISNIKVIYLNIISTMDFIFALLRPFIIGFFIAYFLNPLVRFIENQKVITSNFKNTSKRRMFSIMVTYLFAVFFLYLVIASILPNVVGNVNTLITTLPSSVESLKTLIDSYTLNDNNILAPTIDAFNNITNQNYSANNLVVSILKEVSEVIFNLPKFFSSLVFGILTFANGMLAIVLGFVISIYMIADKEYFIECFKKIVCVITKKSTSEKIFRIASLSNNIFERFIIGKAIDSFIIGLMFFVICLIFKVPYAPLFGLIIGITNMIPYFGPFIGAIPVLIITVTWNYKMVIPMGVAILILQQFDGIILGPRILGDSIGLKPISIVFAIIVGGGLFGIVGMFLGAPVYAVISTILQELINKNYEKKVSE